MHRWRDFWEDEFGGSLYWVLAATLLCVWLRAVFASVHCVMFTTHRHHARRNNPCAITQAARREVTKSPALNGLQPG